LRRRALPVALLGYQPQSCAAMVRYEGVREP
jgi:hypothetical protein